MTLTEVLVVVMVIAVLVVMMLPTLSDHHHTSPRIYCVSNLKQIGIAFKIWESDHNDKYPTQLGSADGGVMELAATGNVAAVLQVMSNELPVTKILICPSDIDHRVAKNWTTDFGNKNISYFIGLDAADKYTNSILTGDSNLEIGGGPVKSGVLGLSSNTPTAWTGKRHLFQGNIGLSDDSVYMLRNFELTNAILKQYAGPAGFTNRFRIVIP